MRSQLILDLNRELIVDNFAGGGGASTGIFLATGRHADIAINHDPEALAMHEMNHPQTLHLCEDVWDVDPREVTKGRPVGLAHFSPDCKDHSKAKGGKPRSKKIRGLAWVMVKWGGLVAPRVMTLENVEEFQEWGRLVAKRCKLTRRVIKIDGSVAAPGEHVPVHLQMLERDKRCLSRIFRRFIRRLRECLRKHGYAMEYKIEWKEMRACDNGAPTIRKRLFIVARRDGEPIVFPAATHGAPDSEGVRKKLLKPFRTAAECIDFTRPCPSIFLSRREARKLRVQRPLANASCRRIAKGVERYVMKAEKPFLVCLTHHGSDRVESVDDPFKTITGAQRGERAVVIPSVTKFRTGSIGSDIEAPLPTVTAGPAKDPAGAAHALGLVAADVAAPFIAKYHSAKRDGGDRVGSVGEPLPTQTTENRFGVIAPLLAGAGGPAYGGKPKPVTEPINALLTENHTALVEPQLASPFLTEHANASAQRNFSADEPLRTQCAEVRGGHFAAVIPCLAGVGGRAAQSRERGIDEPTGTGTTKADTVLVAAHVARQFGTSVGMPVDQPMGTVMADGGGGKSQEIATFLAQHNTGVIGHSVEKPMSTLTGTCSHQNLVAVSLLKYYRTEQDPNPREPMHTIPTKDRIGESESSVTIPPLTPERAAMALRVAAFLREHGVEVPGEYATTRSGLVIYDIGMRMLEPRELYMAQGFPAHYIIDQVWVKGPDGAWLTDEQGNRIRRKLPKHAQVRMCGNSVCPQQYAAIVEANCPELIIWDEGERAA